MLPAVHHHRRVLPAWMLKAPPPLPPSAVVVEEEEEGAQSARLALIERTEAVLCFLEDTVLAPPQLEWGVFDYDGQEAELREEAAAGFFALDECDLMERMTLEALLEPLAASPPEGLAAKSLYYNHEPERLHRDLSAALRRLRSA